MATNLKITKLNAVHLVDKGAAVGPRVLVIKRDKTRVEDSLMPSKEQTAAIAKAVSEAVAGVLAKADSITEMTPQQLLEQALTNVDESTRAAIMAAVGAMYQAKPPEAPKPAEPAKVEGEDKDKPADEPKPKPEPEVEKVEDEEAKEEMEKVLKGMKPADRAIIEKALEAKDAKIEKSQDVATRLESAEKEIAKSAAKAELAEMVAISKKFPHVPGDIKKRAAALLVLKKSDKKAYDEMLEQWKSANTLIAKTKTRGTSRVEGDEDLENDNDERAEAKLDRLATEMMNKAIEKGEKKLTYEKCYSRVAKMNPELRIRARKEAN